MSHPRAAVELPPRGRGLDEQRAGHLAAALDQDERCVGLEEAGEISERRQLVERRVVRDRLARAWHDHDAAVDVCEQRIAIGDVFRLWDRCRRRTQRRPKRRALRGSGPREATPSAAVSAMAPTTVIMMAGAR